MINLGDWAWNGLAFTILVIVFYICMLIHDLIEKKTNKKVVK